MTNGEKSTILRVRPTDTCECCDYRRDHRHGPCGFKDGCKEFRLSKEAPTLDELRTLASEDHGISPPAPIVGIAASRTA